MRFSSCLRTFLILATAWSGFAGEVRFHVQNFAGTGVAGFSGDGGPALEAQLNNPFGLTRGPDGALYLCDTGNHRIRRVDGNGIITTVAGNGERGYSGDGGPALEAALNEPYELRFDGLGNLYFVEMRNHVVRRVDRESGRIETVAGNGRDGFSGDGGPAVQAQLKRPHSIQFGPDEDLYICDIGNHRIRKLTLPGGMIQTYAGTGERAVTADGAERERTPLNGPRAIDFDSEGNLWIALREGNALLRLDGSSERYRRVAGNGRKGFTGNGGPAREATLSGPKGVSVAVDGWVYLADTESHSIRAVDPEGRIHLVAGTGMAGDGPAGPGDRCRLSRPHGVYAAENGEVFIGDSEAHRVRVVRKE